MEIRTLSLVIGSQDYGEADRLLTLYTEDLGKLSVLAPSARRSTKRLGSGVSVLSFGDAVLKQKRGSQGYLLEQFRGQRSFVTLASDLELYSCALYACELCDALFPWQQVEPMVLGQLVRSFFALESIQDRREISVWLRLLEVKLLELGGFAFRVDSCSHCFRSIPVEQKVAFHTNQGGIACFECMSAAHCLLSDGAKGVLHWMNNVSFDDWPKNIFWDTAILRELKDILRRSLSKHITKPLKIPLFWQQSLAAI